MKQNNTKVSGRNEMTRAQRLANGPGPNRIRNEAKAAARAAGEKQFTDPGLAKGQMRYDASRKRIVVGSNAKATTDALKAAGMKNAEASAKAAKGITAA